MRIPYCFFPEKIAKRGASLFYWMANFIKKSKPQIELELRRAEIKTDVLTYLGASVFSDFFLFLVVFLASIMLFTRYNTKSPVLMAAGISLLITLFIFFQQMTYPKAIVNKKVKNIERHLLSSLRSMQIQVSSGIPLYEVIFSISKENYGGVSTQFKRVVKEINSGMQQTDALEKMASENPSIYFQRIVWQISTAIKSGSNLSKVLAEIIQSLSEEQIVQVQDYGSSLNPLTMFYMLLVVVVPALSITFLVVLSSFIAMDSITLKSLFWALYGAVFVFQLFFISMIVARRPNLL
ncbi:type II secretion system F family protein [candidate division KSB1 bacterium]